ncbi:ABC-type branched-subunit amino acid transport system substrate-binding protein [Sphingobium sp. OAS761]|uniref:ABC transporter substrate-binding protein n=1 Tax=Sphingobium sp. OAS761 TaxID=2817901 RepID=UPI00209EB354|nr:ABC transporter substrate-binding protein [Sphingobium sp. OAS761]MCP1472307.1 ABC-type branched-subunit amino acid transport system substrate-binding protein [Sphingobium sp. OAS761]
MSRRDQYKEPAEPLRVGLLLDNPPRYTDLAEKIYDLILEQYKKDGRFERGIELIKVYPYGPPAGFIQNSIDAFHELCDQGVIAVLGGHHADDSISIAPEADKREVVFLNTGATTHAMSKWSFSISWGSVPHDVYTLASWLRKKGYTRVAITWDRADHIVEGVTHFRNACRRAGIKILYDVRFPQTITPDLQEVFAEAHQELASVQPQAIAHFGSGAMSYHWAAYVTRNWPEIPRIMNDAFHGATNADAAAGFEGWVGTTHWDDANQVNARFREAYAARYPGETIPSGEMIGIFHDMMTTFLEGVTLAPIMNRDGIRRGLEMVQMLPAATGGARTCIGFSPHNHRGIQGADAMVVRRMRDGALVMEDRIDLF